MNISVPEVLRSLSTAGSAISLLVSWRKRVKGDVRALVGELRDNLTYLDMVAEDGVSLGDVIEKVSLDEFKRLSKDGFDFNLLERGKIQNYSSLKGTDLSPWVDKETEELVVAIYDKLNELKLRYPLVSKQSNYRWPVRVNNIRKRIWLLLLHVEGQDKG